MVGEPIPLLLDTNVLIDLLKLGVLADVARLPGYSLVVPAEVKNEVLRPEQAAALDSAIAAGRLSEAAVDTLEEQALFAGLTAVIGTGEAACLAIARHRGLSIASDETDPKFMRDLLCLVGEHRLVRTPQLLAEAISAGLLSVDRLQGAVAALAATAVSPRDRDDVQHLERVLGRVRSIMEQGE